MEQDNRDTDEIELPDDVREACERQANTDNPIAPVAEILLDSAEDFDRDNE